MHNLFGPYRIVDQSSPVHFRLRTDTNKKVTFAVHTNRMKPFIDPDLRPIDPPLFDDPSEPYLDETYIPNNSFEKGQPVTRAECDQPAALQSQSQSQLHPEQVTIDNKTIFNAKKILVFNVENEKERIKV